MLLRSTRVKTSRTQLGGLSTKRVQTVALHLATGRPKNGPPFESLNIAGKVSHLKELTRSRFCLSRENKELKETSKQKSCGGGTEWEELIPLSRGLNKGKFAIRF